MRRLVGFSLVEVLVAFAILTGVLIVIVPAVTGPTGEGATRIERAFARDFAMSRLARLGATQRIEPGETQGQSERWVWRERVQRSHPYGVPKPVFSVTVEVFDLSGRTRLARVEAFR